MITFAANQYPMKITNDQLTTIYRLAGGSDAEVVDHEPSPIVEVIIGHTRHHVDEDGSIFLVEHATVVDDDWDWQPVDQEPRNHPDTEVLHEAKESIGEDVFESGIILVGKDQRPVAYAQLGKTTVCISRGQGKVSIEIDDMAEEDVYASVNLQTLTAIEGDDEQVPWNGRQ